MTRRSSADSTIDKLRAQWSQYNSPQLQTKSLVKRNKQRGKEKNHRSKSRQKEVSITNVHTVMNLFSIINIGLTTFRIDTSH